MKIAIASAALITFFLPTGAFSQTDLRSNSLESDLRNLQTTFNQRRPKGEGIRRGEWGNLCAVSPGTDALQNSFIVWSDRPLFLWKTDASQVTVERLQVIDSSSEEVMWDWQLKATDQQIVYAGKPLQPGQIYSWELKFNRLGNSFASQENITVDYRFQVMAAVQRSQISAELQTLTTPLLASGATADAIATQQAQFFAEKGLLSDALQVLYAIQKPSTALTKTMQSLVYAICKPSEKKQ